MSEKKGFQIECCPKCGKKINSSELRKELNKLLDNKINIYSSGFTIHAMHIIIEKIKRRR